MRLAFRPEVAIPLVLAILLIDSVPARAGLTLAWTKEAGYDEAVLGKDVHAAGDVNGDGYDDVILAAPGVSSQQGIVSVHYGSPTGITDPAAWTMTGSTLHYGEFVSTAGDVNGDGYDDVLIGTDDYANGHQREGQVQLFLGSASGLALTPVWEFESNNLLAGLGPVAFAGDVNDDGYDDFLMSAPYYDSNNGKVWLYYGSASGTPAFAWSATSGLGELLGYDVSTAGDVNGDGRADILIGTYWSERILVGISNPATTIDLVVINSPSAVAAAHFGFDVCTIGDANGDGYSDIAVGAPHDSTDQWHEGKVYVYRGSAAGITTTPIWQYESDFRNAEFGARVEPAGDVNGDGYGDALFAADRLTNGDNFEGAAWVFNGTTNVLNSTPYWYFESGASPGLFGKGLSCAGDVNGDGYSDIIVGASAFEETAEFDEGKVWLWHGGPDAPAYVGHASEMNQEMAHYGASVCFGDFDGDSFSDRVIAAPLFDLGIADQGQVSVFQGKPGAPDMFPLVNLTYQVRADHFGTDVANAHDVDGDGYDDLIVGGPLTFDGSATPGAAHIYWGNPAFLSNASLSTLWGPHSFSSFGHSVNWAGDVNGDGFSDVIVGAPHFDNSRNDEGAAYVYLGSAAGIASTPVWSWEGGVEDALFGWDVSYVGDVNQDGFGDVIVGAPGHSEGIGSGYGRVYVFFGDASGISSDAPWIVDATGADEFGYAVAGCDANGDGFSDVIVGAPGYGADDRGRAYLYVSDGVNLSDTPQLELPGTGIGHRLGTAVAAGDFDQDGQDEIVVGVPFVTNGQTQEGQVRIYALDGTLIWAADGNAPNAWHGTAVASRGDTNGDGFPDILSGAPGLENPHVEEGIAFTWLGNGGQSLNLSPGLRRRAHQAVFDNSQPLGLLGDNDAGSVRLESDGRSPMGRDDVALEVEVKPYGVPFDGTGLLSTSFVDTGAPASYGSTANLHVIATGILSDTRYHWRARHVSRHPYASSPWFGPAGNAWEEFDFRRGGNATSVAEVAGAAGRAFGLSGFPSPFVESAVIAFEIPRDADVNLSVFDVAGRRVDTLLSGRVAAGSHSVRWNGTDSAGRRVSSGVYFAVIESDERRGTRRLVITR